MGQPPCRGGGLGSGIQVGILNIGFCIEPCTFGFASQKTPMSCAVGQQRVQCVRRDVQEEGSLEGVLRPHVRAARVLWGQDRKLLLGHACGHRQPCKAAREDRS